MIRFELNLTLEIPNPKKTQNPNPKERGWIGRGTHLGSSTAVASPSRGKKAPPPRGRTSQATRRRAKSAAAVARAQGTDARPLDGGALTLGRTRALERGPAAAPLSLLQPPCTAVADALLTRCGTKKEARGGRKQML